MDSQKISIKRLSLLVVPLLVAAGCVPNAAVKDSNSAVLTSGYDGAARTFIDDSGVPVANRDDLEELLVAGKSLHDAGLWEESNDLFGSASEKLMWKEDTIDTPEEALRFVGTTLTNDTLGDYTGKIYEGLMLDYYQALNSLMLGDENGARVSLNRLDERQRNAEIQLQAYTRSLKSAEVGADDEGDQELVDKSIEAADVDFVAGIKNLPENLMAAQIRAPSGDLLNAVFRQTSSAGQDRISDKTENAIKAVQVKAPNEEARRFAGELEKVFVSPNKDRVFVIYEDGTGPAISEFRVDLPLALVSDDLLYAGVALPEFVTGQVANPAVLVSQGDVSVETVPITDLNRVASLEFQAAYDKKVAKEITSTVIKTVAQVAANKAIDEEVENPIAGLFMKVAVASAQAALTQADTRHWTNLPNQIQMATFEKTGNQQIYLSTPSGTTLATVPALPGNQLIYVRQQTLGGDVKVFTQRLPARDRAVEVASNWSPAE